MPTKLKAEPAVTPPPNRPVAVKKAPLPEILAEIQACVFGLASIGGLSTYDREKLEELRQKIAAELAKA